MLYVSLAVRIPIAMHRRHHLFVSSFIVQQKGCETNQKLRNSPYTRRNAVSVQDTYDFLRFQEALYKGEPGMEMLTLPRCV